MQAVQRVIQIKGKKLFEILQFAKGGAIAKMGIGIGPGVAAGPHGYALSTAERGHEPSLAVLLL